MNQLDDLINKFSIKRLYNIVTISDGIMHVIPCSTYTHAVHYAHDMLHDKFTYKINFLISIKIFLSHLSIHTFSYIWNLCIMRMINAHVHDAHDMLQKCAFCPSLIILRHSLNLIFVYRNLITS